MNHEFDMIDDETDIFSDKTKEVKIYRNKIR